MKRLQPGRKSFLILLPVFVFIEVYAQDKDNKPVFTPHVGQPGKDVIWVPTPAELVNKMLEIAGVTENDYLIDLGSGDGRMVIAAAKLGARAKGIEYNPDMIEISKKNAEEANVSMKTNFVQADFYHYDLSEATVITMFLLPEINLKLRPRLLTLKPGTRIVSNTFTMGDWEPDSEATTDGNLNSWYTALMWIIPAKVEGKWNMGSGILTLQQEFQKVYGTLTEDNKTFTVSEGRLAGDLISFIVDGVTYSGIVTGDTIKQNIPETGHHKKEWIATRRDY
jgi:SAM-dependent methyltransferase